MIRVAQIIWAPQFGGIEKLACDVGRVLAKDPGCQPSIVFGKAEGTFRSKFQESGIPCHDLNLRSGFDLAPSRIRAARRLLSNFDVLHLHTFVPGLALSASLSGRPVVYTEHGNFGFGRNSTWRDALRRHLLSWFVRKKASHLTFNSEFTRNTWNSRMNSGSTPQSVVANGVNLDELHSLATTQPTGLEETLRGKFVVGMTGRFAAVKKIDRLIRAFSRASKQHNMHLLLVGDGPLRPELERLVKELGITSQVLFAGFQARARDYQALMDVCVLPSQNESFGLAVVEALAMGKPSLVFEDGGGAADIIRVFEPDDLVADEAALASRLADYAGNIKRIHSRREDRIAYSRQFDIRATAKGFQDIYRDIRMVH